MPSNATSKRTTYRLSLAATLAAGLTLSLSTTAWASPQPGTKGDIRNTPPPASQWAGHSPTYNVTRDDEWYGDTWFPLQSAVPDSAFSPNVYYDWQPSYSYTDSWSW